MVNTVRHIFQVLPQEGGLRVDSFAKQKLPQYSRTFFQKLVADDRIFINDKLAKSSTWVKNSDTVIIDMPIEGESIILDDSLKKKLVHYQVAVLYQCDAFMIISKPAGLLTHKRSEKSDEVTLVDWLVNYCAAIKNVGQSHRPGIVHRLDKDTSGIMIIPLTNQAHEKFTNMFIERAICKSYLAIVEGHPEKTGLIDLAIGRHPSIRTKMATNSVKTRDAFTQYRVMEYFEKHSLLELEPKTGRTHQIRVHCQAIGHPLVGDGIYGKKSLDFARHALHAFSIAFTYEGKEYTFKTEPPEDFKALCQKLSSLKD